jgi:hypothetical protein
MKLDVRMKAETLFLCLQKRASPRVFSIQLHFPIRSVLHLLEIRGPFQMSTLYCCKLHRRLGCVKRHQQSDMITVLDRTHAHGHGLCCEASMCQPPQLGKASSARRDEDNKSLTAKAASGHRWQRVAT